MLTTKLLKNIKRRVTMPANQRLLDDTDILEICDSVIMERIVPEIVSLRQNFFVTKSDITLVKDQAKYPIPYRAMGRTLRDAKVRYDDGAKKDLSLLDIEDEHLVGTKSSTPDYFYFMGDSIVVVPTPQDTLTLELWWELPPSSLIAESNACKVVAVMNDEITVDTVPTVITASSDIDIITGKAGYSTHAYDLTITGINSTVLSFSAGTLTDLEIGVGDYISIAGTSPVVQLPNECNPFLETLAARRVLQAIGDFEGLKMLGEDESEDIRQLRRLLEPRVRGESTKIVNRNGLLKGSRARFRRGAIY